MRLGSPNNYTLADCKLQCLQVGNTACGAIYSESNGASLGLCELFPKSACVIPAGVTGTTNANPGPPTGKIFLLAGAWDLYRAGK